MTSTDRRRTRSLSLGARWCQVTGRSLGQPAEQEAACRELLRESKLGAVALTLGAEGALLVWPGGLERLRPPLVPVRSSVGAGDSFLGGLVLSLARGLSLPEAFRWGVAAGTAALLTPGTELCRREDYRGAPRPTVRRAGRLLKRRGLSSLP